MTDGTAFLEALGRKAKLYAPAAQRVERAAHDLARQRGGCVMAAEDHPSRTPR